MKNNFQSLAAKCLEKKRKGGEKKNQQNQQNNKTPKQIFLSFCIKNVNI